MSKNSKTTPKKSTKSTPKKSTKSTPKKASTPVAKASVPDLPKQPKRVNAEIKKASNGYIVSSHDEDWNEKTYIAKSKADALKRANKLMNI